MKRIIVFSILAIAIIAFTIMNRFLIVIKNMAPTVQVTSTPLPTQREKQLKTITFHTEEFAYAYFIVKNPANLSLIPNFLHPKDAGTLMTENNCVSAINGGFYDKLNKPLGYFQSDEKTFSPKIDSDLFNGFIWVDASGTAVISTELPNTTFQFVLQTGPMLIFNSNSLLLTINNDAHARRMIAAKNNSLIFMAVYKGESVFDGPMLADLPKIIEEISTKENLNIMDAVNLDGGGASAFYSVDTKLSELTPIGSLFCAK